MNPEDYIKYRKALHEAVLDACDNYTGDAADGYELAEHLCEAGLEPIYCHDGDTLITVVAKHTQLTAVSLAVDVANTCRDLYGRTVSDSQEVAAVLMTTGLRALAYATAEAADANPEATAAELVSHRLTAEPCALLEMCLAYDE